MVAIERNELRSMSHVYVHTFMFIHIGVKQSEANKMILDTLYQLLEI